MRNVVVAGSTGLVGREVIAQLTLRQDLRAVALVRRPSGLARPPVVRERVFVFDQGDDYAALGGPECPCDVFLCALGTTQRQAGSKEAFQAVDRDIPLRLAARLLAVNPSCIFGLVSSVGADRPTGFYLRTKAELEAGLEALGLPQVILRPSLLLGSRQESRPGESLAAAVLPAIYRVGDVLHLTEGAGIQRYRPVGVQVVARTLIHYTLERPVSGRLVIEGRAFVA